MTEQGAQAAILLAIGLSILGAVVLAFACASSEINPAKPDEDDYESAALDLSKVYRGDIICGLAPDRRKEVKDRIEAYRKEAESIEDPKWRRAHLGWVNYSERRYKESVEVWERNQRVNACRLENPIK